MAQLKDTIITGDASITGTLSSTKIQGNILLVPTTSNGITYGAGTAGQVLTTNGTSVYWAAVDALPAQSASTNGRYLVSNGTSGAAWAESVSGSLLDIDNIPTSASTHLVTSGGVYDMIISQQTKYYGVCDTAAETKAKTVSISGITELTVGLGIHVKFSNNQTYNGTPTLQVNSLTAKNIVRNGTTGAARYQWQAGEVLDLVYDGTNWVIVNNALATTAYYGLTKLSNQVTSESITEAATPYAVKIAYDVADEAYDLAYAAVPSSEKSISVATLATASDSTTPTVPRLTPAQGFAPIFEIDSDTTLAAKHAGGILVCTNSPTITIPVSVFDAATEIEILNYGTGIVTVAGASGVSLNGASAGSKQIKDQYTSGVLLAISASQWVIQGAIE